MHPLFLISERLRKGFADIIELRQGLKLIINNYTPRKTVEVNFKVDSPPIDFAFCISGRAEAEVFMPNEEKIPLKFHEGMSTVFFFPNSKGRIKFFADDTIKILSLHISPEFLSNFIDNDTSGLPQELSQIMSGNEDMFFIKNSILTPAMKIAVNQILDTKLRSASRKMFLESKALELMSLGISQIISDSSNDETNMSLSEKEIKSAEETKELIDKEFINPPPLSKLALKAGMSHTKLNFAFQKLYGETVFKYIRRLRLEYSIQLLEEKKMNITQIAYEAGWSNPSHFSREFLKHYGVSPKKYRKGK